MYRYVPRINVGIALAGLLVWAYVMGLSLSLDYWRYIFLALVCDTILSLYLLITIRAWWRERSGCGDGSLL